MKREEDVDLQTLIEYRPFFSDSLIAALVLHIKAQILLAHY